MSAVPAVAESAIRILPLLPSTRWSIAASLSSGPFPHPSKRHLPQLPYREFCCQMSIDEAATSLQASLQPKVRRCGWTRECWVSAQVAVVAEQQKTSRLVTKMMTDPPVAAKKQFESALCLSLFLCVPILGAAKRMFYRSAQEKLRKIGRAHV